MGRGAVFWCVGALATLTGACGTGDGGGVAPDIEQRPFVSPVSKFPLGSVTTVEAGGFHLVRLSNGDFLAFSWRDPHSGCTVPWSPPEDPGFFHDPCTGSIYGMDGEKLAGPAPRSLDRFKVTVRGNEVIVDTATLVWGEPAAGLPPRRYQDEWPVRVSGKTAVSVATNHLGRLLPEASAGGTGLRAIRVRLAPAGDLPRVREGAPLYFVYLEETSLLGQGWWVAVDAASGLVRAEGRLESPPLPDTGPGARPAVETVAGGLEVPWALAFAPDRAGTIYITERPGRVRVIREGRLLPAPALTLPVAAEGEGGLLGLALDPDFRDTPYVYLYYTYRSAADGGLRNRVSRFKVAERDEAAGVRLGEEEVLLDGLPGARVHDGGRLAFGPDGKLYVTTGDAGRPALAADPGSLAGKVLRVNDDGSVPADNPFPGSPVWSYGHRNPQGLAWHPRGALFAAEHGDHLRGLHALAGDDAALRADRRLRRAGTGPDLHPPGRGR